MPAKHKSDETTKPEQAAAEEQLLGEIETRIAGMQYHEAGVRPGEQINLEREPDNPHDECAIVVENGHFEPVGHVSRRLCPWLAPLIDEGKVRVEGYVPKSARPGHTRSPLTLTVFLCEKGRHFLEKGSTGESFNVLHEVVRQAYQDAHEYADPELITELADGLRPLTRQELLPETRLLLALLPGLAQERRTAKAFEAMANMQELLGKITIGEPLHHHNLTVFPLSWPKKQKPAYDLLSYAIEQGDATVEEVDEDGEVPNLSVTNSSDRPILIPEGEILVGAKQNRVVNVTVLVAAQSTFKVPVSCVEQGRWRYQSRRFSNERCTPPSLRSKKMRSVQATRASQGTANSDQGEVWDEVEACLCSMGVDSETSSLTDGFAAAEDELQTYRTKLQLPKNAAGVVVARGDQVIGMDLFGSRDTLSAQWERLSDAYFLDALRNKRRRKKAAKELAGQFIEQTTACAKPRVPALGLGAELEIAGEDVVGGVLLFSGQICHLSAFSGN